MIGLSVATTLLFVTVLEINRLICAGMNNRITRVCHTPPFNAPAFRLAKSSGVRKQETRNVVCHRARACNAVESAVYCTSLLFIVQFILAVSFLVLPTPPSS